MHSLTATQLRREDQESAGKHKKGWVSPWEGGESSRGTDSGLQQSLDSLTNTDRHKTHSQNLIFNSPVIGKLGIKQFW